MKSLNFDYHYGAEADQYTFLRIPKVLITAPHFKNLSMEAKVLYGLMLDRMGLSIKNRWIDEQNRVYIYFTLDDVQECMSCGHTKGVKLLAELDTKAGIGLIERVKQGQGKPTVIYVKNFILRSDSELDSEVIHNGSQDISKQEVRTSQNRKSRLNESGSADFPKTDTNKTNLNQIYTNDTECQSIYPVGASHKPSQNKQKQESDINTAIDMIDRYRELIKDNLDYDCIIQDCRKEQIDEIVEIMTEAVTTSKEYLFVGQERLPTAVVKSVLLKLGIEHIKYVIDSMKDNPSKIRNIRAYILTCLYKSHSSISSYYTALVNHDFYGK